jgi:hypothetical protein
VVYVIKKHPSFYYSSKNKNKVTSSIKYASNFVTYEEAEIVWIDELEKNNKWSVIKIYD